MHPIYFIVLAIFLNTICGNEVVFDSMLVFCMQERDIFLVGTVNWITWGLGFAFPRAINMSISVGQYYTCLVASGYIVALRRKFILYTLPVYVLVFWYMESMSLVVTRPSTNLISGRSRVDSIFCRELFFMSLLMSVGVASGNVAPVGLWNSPSILVVGNSLKKHLMTSDMSGFWTVLLLNFNISMRTEPFTCKCIDGLLNSSTKYVFTCRNRVSKDWYIHCSASWF